MNDEYKGLPDIRMALADARATLRQAKDNYSGGKAWREAYAIESAGGEKLLGANSEARERALTVALNRDAIYLKYLRELREAEADVERLEAALEGALDARRHEELLVRARLCDVLAGQSLQVSSKTPHAPFEAVLERVADASLAIGYGLPEETFYE